MTIRTSLAGRNLGVVAVLTAVLAAGVPASAGVVSYTLSGRLDGSIGGTALTDTPFTWTVRADNLVTSVQAAGLPALQGLSSDIRLAGIGDAGFAQPVFVIDSASSSLFAFTDQAAANGVSWTSPALASLPLGAAYASQPVAFNDAAGSLQTSLGAFQLTDATDLTFAATVAPTPPVVYTLKGELNGSLGGAAFTDDPFSWTVTTDTTGLASYFGLPALKVLNGAIDLGGFGHLLPKADFDVAINPGGGVLGFVSTDGQQGLGVSAAAFQSYTLGGGLTGLPVDFSQSVPVDTSGGEIDISGADHLTLSAMSLPVPEPSTWAFTFAGLALVGAALRSRRGRGSAVAG